jgi:hypothetical protein
MWPGNTAAAPEVGDPARARGNLVHFRPTELSAGKSRKRCDERSLSHLAETDQRSAGRSNVFLSAVLHGGAGPAPVRIRNISPTGALIEAASLPPAGTAIQLVRGDLCASGEIAWTSAGHAGIRFVDAVDVEGWVKRVGHSGQQRVDGVVAALRRSESVPPELQKGGSLDSLRSISTALDELCGTLAAADVPLELGEQLIKLDSIAQALRRVATGRSF